MISFDIINQQYAAYFWGAPLVVHPIEILHVYEM